MINSSLTLPLPSQEAQAHSKQLSEHLIKEIQHAGGKIPFSVFMEQALYTPGLGYYASRKNKFGYDGDFVTASELTPLFSQCIAHAITPFFQQQHEAVFLELGAGSGKCAANLLQHCPDIQHYWILEVSASLRKQQEETLQACGSQVFAKVKWLDRLPKEPFSGIIFANEVIDAFPASRFHWKEKSTYEYYVKEKDGQFFWSLDIPSNPVITDFSASLELPSQYSSEMHLLLKPWIRSLSECLREGALLLIDYGFPRREYYHPDRREGTLMCHYRHYAHSDPFFWPGLQDLTAHVDFTAIAEAAVDSNLTVAGYTTQAAFLLENRILDFARSPIDNQHIKTLTLPSEMGELFKVILLKRHLESTMTGFMLQDHRFRL